MVAAGSREKESVRAGIEPVICQYDGNHVDLKAKATNASVFRSYSYVARLFQTYKIILSVQLTNFYCIVPSCRFSCTRKIIIVD